MTFFLIRTAMFGKIAARQCSRRFSCETLNRQSGRPNVLRLFQERLENQMQRNRSQALQDPGSFSDLLSDTVVLTQGENISLGHQVPKALKQMLENLPDVTVFPKEFLSEEVKDQPELQFISGRVLYCLDAKLNVNVDTQKSRITRENMDSWKRAYSDKALMRRLGYDRVEAAVVCLGYVSPNGAARQVTKRHMRGHVKGFDFFFGLFGEMLFPDVEFEEFLNFLKAQILERRDRLALKPVIQAPPAVAIQTRSAKEGLMPLLKWTGSKWDEIHQFERYLPTAFRRYIEPFAGSLSVFNHIAHRKIVGHERSVVADVHPELICFYKQIQEGNGPELFERLATCTFTAEEYYRVRNQPPDEQTDPLSRAFYFYYLNITSFRGMLRYRKAPDGNMTFNIPYGRNKIKLSALEKLKNEDYINLFQNTEIIQAPFQEVFRRFSDPEDFYFLDPPYDSSFSDYGYGQFGREEHENLARLFKSTPAKALMIIGKTPFTLQLYEGFIKGSYPKRYKIKILEGRVGIQAEHLIVANYTV